MKKESLKLVVIVLILFLLKSCGGVTNESAISFDFIKEFIDVPVSNEASISNKATTSYEVKIGKQIWMSKNLNVNKFRNGDQILHAKTNEEWKRAGKNKQPAWCYFENDPVNGKKYGKLYNWYAVNDSRGLAPEGWKIPSSEEWETLINYLGGEEKAGHKMKSTYGWEKEDNGTNESGFSVLPGGYRDNDAYFRFFKYYSKYWSFVEYSSDSASYTFVSFIGTASSKFNDNKDSGFSVRCIRD